MDWTLTAARAAAVPVVHVSIEPRVPRERLLLLRPTAFRAVPSATYARFCGLANVDGALPAELEAEEGHELVHALGHPHDKVPLHYRRRLPRLAHGVVPCVHPGVVELLE